MIKNHKKDMFSLFLVGYTKFSGFARDILIITLFGFSLMSDALFISMTIVMFFQLIGYQGNINILGRSLLQNRVLAKFTKNINIYLCFLTLLFQIFSNKHLYSIGIDIWYLNITVFLILAPMSLLVGLFAGQMVLRGENNFHALITSIQNTVLVITIPVTLFFGYQEYIFICWFLSYAAVLSFIVAHPKFNGIYNTQPSEQKYSNKRWLLAYFNPLLLFSVVIVERIFYGQVTGSLGVIKILETGMMAVIFVLEIIFLNKLLAQIKKNSVLNTNILLGYKHFRNNLMKAMFVGFLLMIIFLLLFNVLIFTDISIFKLNTELKDVLLAFSILYLLYFCMVCFRDYITKFIFIYGTGTKVVNADIFIFLFTVILNITFMKFVPLSILLISILLLFFKNIYLLKFVQKKVRYE